MEGDQQNDPCHAPARRTSFRKVQSWQVTNRNEIWVPVWLRHRLTDHLQVVLVHERNGRPMQDV